MNIEKSKRLKELSMKRKAILLSGLIAVSSSACVTKYNVSPANSGIEYDTINTMDSDLVNNGIEQILDVPDEDFKLEVNYRCVLEKDSKWTVTSDKEIFMDINTIGLESGYKVYIDNVHMDATIRSYYPQVDGITQDSMDDRIHNSQMYGFPINNSISYNNVFNIEGQNDTFIHGTILGFNGIVSGTIEERRFVEEEYLENGVYANKINAIIDLIVVRSDESTHCVSVPSTIQVTVWPFIRYTPSDSSKEDKYNYYYFDEEHNIVNYKEITESEYQEMLDGSELKKILK